jgi:hypothetical protein
MVVRVLFVLAAFVVLYGCGQASSPVEQQEQGEGVEQAAEGEEEQPETVTPQPVPEPTTEQAVGNIPIAGVIGENVEAGSFDLRVLDYFVTDHYYYVTDPYFEDFQDAFSQAGKFVVVNYSVTNTSPQTVGPNLLGDLHVTAPDGKTEIYDQTDVVTPPHRGAPNLYLDDIPPRGMLVSQFISDVPTDVDPELLVVTEEPQIATVYDVGTIDLTEDDPQGPRPEEVFALQMEYVNVTAYEQAYELYAQESKARVPEQVFVSKNQEGDKENLVAFTKYSFPTVKVEGDNATMQAVRSYSDEAEGEGQERITQEAVLEDEGWRVVMRDEQYKFYGG